MRALIQRVNTACVLINSQEKRHIGKGLVVFWGTTAHDSEKDMDWLAEKIVSMRLFPKPDETKSEFDLSVHDIDGEILLISQFTLYADCRKGRRPDFSHAAAPTTARPLYEQFTERLRRLHPKIVTGEFGSSMRVDIQNQGPVTISLDTHE